MKFLSPLRVELVDHAGQGTWRLLEPLHFEHDSHGLLTVPAGFETDFASVPRAPLAYWLTGNTAHAPATLHDWLCRDAVMPRKEADAVFREAMLAVGVPVWRAKSMWLAVSAYTRSLKVELFGAGKG